MQDVRHNDVTSPEGMTMDAQEAVAALEAAGVESAALKDRIDAMQADIDAIELRIEAMEATNAAVRGYLGEPPAIVTA